MVALVLALRALTYTVLGGSLLLTAAILAHALLCRR